MSFSSKIIIIPAELVTNKKINADEYRVYVHINAYAENKIDCEKIGLEIALEHSIVKQCVVKLMDLDLISKDLTIN